MKHLYKNQVSLLLSVIPEVAKQDVFALHGGTAINLFVRDMPRLSVDIDLTYLPVEDRQTSLRRISDALLQIGQNIERTLPDIKVTHLKEEAKLLVSNRRAAIKIEVNKIKRGCYVPPSTRILCKKAREQYGVFCEIPVVELGVLYGGKICAALARQHPRDLFDIKYLLDEEYDFQQLKTGFLFYLISGERPIRELLFPHFIDQRKVFDNQFVGMTNEKFDYADFEQTRERLVQKVHDLLNSRDVDFLLSIKEVEPNWNEYSFASFPAIQWKLENLRRLKENQPRKHREQYMILQENLMKIFESK